MSESFETILTGGHPNSLGRTVEVVNLVLAEPSRFEDLFRCYQSKDEVVRLRTSSAVKRVEAERSDLLIPYIDRFIHEIGVLDQASAQWTLAQLFDRLREQMSAGQKQSATAIMKRNLEHHNDWIVLIATMETLSNWAQADTGLKTWLEPHLRRLSDDHRKSVANRAKKKLSLLYGN